MQLENFDICASLVFGHCVERARACSRQVWDLATSTIETRAVNAARQCLRALTAHRAGGQRADAINIFARSLTFSAAAVSYRLRAYTSLSLVLVASRSSAPASRTTLKGPAQQMVQRCVPELVAEPKTASLG